MKRAAIALSFLLVAGCGSKRTPPIQVFPDMKDQPKYLPQTASRFFSDGRELRPPVPGTVARGYLKDDEFYTGMRDGAFVANPLPMDRATLMRGQERYNIYCTPCHDRTGSGRGIVALRSSSWLPSDLTEARIRQMRDGQVFDTITHGKRTMPGYRFQVGERDRWAIVAYLRALERAAAGTVADVPEELRNDLR
jgi:mono/diheme cytochrome c family protein